MGRYPISEFSDQARALGRVSGELTPEETGRRIATAVNAFLDTFDPRAR